MKVYEQMKQRIALITALLATCICNFGSPNGFAQSQQDLTAQAESTLKRAVEFFHQQVAVEGGYMSISSVRT